MSKNISISITSKNQEMNWLRTCLCTGSEPPSESRVQLGKCSLEKMGPSEGKKHRSVSMGTPLGEQWSPDTCYSWKKFKLLIYSMISILEIYWVLLYGQTWPFLVTLPFQPWEECVFCRCWVQCPTKSLWV